MIINRREMLAGLLVAAAGCAGDDSAGNKSASSDNQPESTPTPDEDGLPDPSEFDKIWSHSHHDDEGEAIEYYDGCVYSGSKDSTIISVDASSGDLIWSQDIHNSFTRDLFASGDIIYSAGRDGDVVAIEQTDGSRVWEHRLHDDSVWEVHEHNGIIYSSGRDAKVIAADASDGSYIWSHSGHHADGDPNSEMIRTINYSDGIVYSAGFDGKIIAADAKTGEIQSEYEFGHTVKSVVSGDGTLYFSPFARDVREDVISIEKLSWERRGIHSHHDQDATGHRGDHAGPEELKLRGGIIYSSGDDGKVVAAYKNDLNLFYSHQLHDQSVRSISAAENYQIFTTARDGKVIKYGPTSNV